MSPKSGQIIEAEVDGAAVHVRRLGALKEGDDSGQRCHRAAEARNGLLQTASGATATFVRVESLPMWVREKGTLKFFGRE